MTPEEFKDKMQKIKDEVGRDEEMAHAMMDDLLIECLVELGYTEGCNIYASQDKWYA